MSKLDWESCKWSTSVLLARPLRVLATDSLNVSKELVNARKEEDNVKLLVCINWWILFTPVLPVTTKLLVASRRATNEDVRPKK